MAERVTTDHAAAWHARAQPLARWAMARVFVRTDRFGGYYRRDGETHKTARPNGGSPEPFSERVAVNHFRATRPEQVIGAYSLTSGRDGFGWWAAWDIDNHGGDGETAERNERYAAHLYGKLAAIGFRPLLCHWGTGGFHCWVFFADRVPGPLLHSFGRWAAADAAAAPFNLPPVESNPKQPSVRDGKFGNWLRVPGRHHTQDRWAAVYDGAAFVQGAQAADLILGLTGDPAGLIPAEARPKPDPPAAAAPAHGPGVNGTRRPVDPGPDVFAAYNQAVSLDEVVAWHERHGHKVTGRNRGRVEFTRSGKAGSGLSFNVQMHGSPPAPITYNFSTGAGMPDKRGLSPAQVRCFYESGSIDQGAMNRLSDALRAELGWPPRGRADRNGKGGVTPPPRGTADAGPDLPPRPRITHNARQLRDVVNDAGFALAQHNQPPRAFDRGGEMVRVRDDKVSGHVIEVMGEHAVRLLLSEAADWFVVKKTSKGDIYEDDAPSTEATAALLSRPEWPGVPYLAGVCSAPMFTAGGRLLTTPGYDAESGYIFRPDPGLDALVIPERPTDAEVAAAVALLLEPIEEFPFADDASRAHALAVMFEPFVRELIDGPTPLRLFEAPTPGSGKTLLLETVAVPAFGGLVDPLQEVSEPDEWRKTLFAALVENPGMVFIDNVNKKLDSAALASALTAKRMRQRILGASRMKSLLIRCLWAATANNARLSRELVRRTVPIRIVPDRENPEEGRAFKRRLPRWALDNRPRLVAAALTLVRAWLAAGKPGGSQTLGMYESWAETVGGILDVAKVPGFLGNLAEYRKTAVDTEGEWRTFVLAWWERYGVTPASNLQLYELAAGAELLGAVPDPHREGDVDRRANRGAKTRFGMQLSKARDQVHAGFKIRHAGEDGHSKMASYRLERVPGNPLPPHESEGLFPGETVVFEG